MATFTTICLQTHLACEIEPRVLLGYRLNYYLAFRNRLNLYLTQLCMKTYPVTTFQREPDRTPWNLYNGKVE